MSDGPPQGWDRVWFLSVTAIPLTVVFGMFGVMLRLSDMNREADCLAAFGPDATPMRDVSGGTLCHMGEGVQIAPTTNSVTMIEAARSFMYSWPMWAYAVVALIIAVFFTGVIVKGARRYAFGGSHD